MVALLLEMKREAFVRILAATWRLRCRHLRAQREKARLTAMSKATGARQSTFAARDTQVPVPFCACAQPTCLQASCCEKRI